MAQPATGIFGQHFNTLANALSARERMQSVYSGNIANADTPNYHANTRSFSDFLAEKQDSASSALATTARGHMQGSSGGSLWQSSLSDKHHARRMDGNDVDIQKEMAGMAQNQLMHELTLRLLKKRLDGMANVIREAGR